MACLIQAVIHRRPPEVDRLPFGPPRRLASPPPPNSTPPDQTFPITLSALRHPSSPSTAWALIYSRHCRAGQLCLPYRASGID